MQSPDQWLSGYNVNKLVEQHPGLSVHEYKCIIINGLCEIYAGVKKSPQASVFLAPKLQVNKQLSEKITGRIVMILNRENSIQQITEKIMEFLKVHFSRTIEDIAVQNPINVMQIPVTAKPDLNITPLQWMHLLCAPALNFMFLAFNQETTAINVNANLKNIFQTGQVEAIVEVMDTLANLRLDQYTMLKPDIKKIISAWREHKLFLTDHHIQC